MITINFANDVKINYFLTVFNEINTDFNAKDFIELTIPLNSNMKSCIAFNQNNEIEDFSILHLCTNEQGKFLFLVIFAILYKLPSIVTNFIFLIPNLF